MKNIILLALLLPGIAFASFDTNLKYGSKGSSVIELQEFLVDQGCLVSEATGNFYSLTLRAVKCFQSAHALPVTGYFGPMSRAVANDMLVAETASSTEEEVATVGAVVPVITPAPVMAEPAPVATTTTIIQYITYNTPAPAPVVTQPVVVQSPAPAVVHPRLYMGDNPLYHFTKDTEWGYFTANYTFAGERISFLAFGVYPDEPDSKPLAGAPSYEKGVFKFISAVPFPAGKYVVKVRIAGNASEGMGQKVSMWTNDSDRVTIENK